MLRESIQPNDTKGPIQEYVSGVDPDPVDWGDPNPFNRREENSKEIGQKPATVIRPTLAGELVANQADRPILFIARDVTGERPKPSIWETNISVPKIFEDADPALFVHLKGSLIAHGSVYVSLPRIPYYKSYDGAPQAEEHLGEQFGSEPSVGNPYKAEYIYQEPDDAPQVEELTLDGYGSMPPVGDPYKAEYRYGEYYGDPALEEYLEYGTSPNEANTIGTVAELYLPGGRGPAGSSS